MADYTYDPEQIRAAANILGQKEEEFDANLSNMETAVNARIEQWLGVSGDEFRAKLAEIRANLAAIGSWLNESQKYLVDLADGVEDEQHDHALIFKSA
ncbi:WXG100 family type VII secretion target [Streptomyces sp. NPDC005125]